MLCFVVVIQSFIMNSHEESIHIHQGCFAGTGAIVRLPQCQWSKPDGYGEISQCITTTKHSKAKPVCIFLGIYVPINNLVNYIIASLRKWAYCGLNDIADILPMAFSYQFPVTISIASHGRIPWGWGYKWWWARVCPGSGLCPVQWEVIILGWPGLIYK